MPTPLELLLDPISILIFALYAGMMIWEFIAPGRADLPRMKGWILRGMTAFAVFFYLSSYLPIFWDSWLTPFQLFDLSNLGTVGGAVVGLLIYECAVWAWHWAMHKYNFLWKVFHQMHHSVERVDTYSAFYFSPLDMIGWTVLGSLCLTLLVGVNPQAVTIIILMTNFFSIFQHSNIKTPVWLGYILQRPESHTIHHAKGIHAYNYSDLPLFDILFGTFKNPGKYEHEIGFYKGASARVIDMIIFRDVTEPKTN